MGTYAGFFLPSILIPIFTLWAYYASFMKYSFEALEQNEFADCASYYMVSQFLSLDLTLNRWTNLLVLMAYPVIFHLFAIYSSLSKTGELPNRPSCFRKKSVPVELPEAAVPPAAAQNNNSNGKFANGPDAHLINGEKKTLPDDDNKHTQFQLI